jgi:hypothetical protein
VIRNDGRSSAAAVGSVTGLGVKCKCKCKLSLTIISGAKHLVVNVNVSCP